jgi:hypothetical protein
MAVIYWKPSPPSTHSTEKDPHQARRALYHLLAEDGGDDTDE